MTIARSPLLAGALGTVTIPSWADGGSLTGVTVGTIVADATFECAGFEVPVTETTGTVVSVTGQVRPTGRLAKIRSCLPFWRSPGQAFFYGAAVDLEPGRQYAYKLIVTDNAAGTQTITGTFTTRAENIATHAALVAAATHWVDPVNGSDAAAGTAPGAAWQTIDYAWTNAPANAVVVLRPGYHSRAVQYNTTSGQNGRTTNITLVAEHPACDDDGNVLSEQAARSYVIPPATHRIAPRAGAWAQVTLSGPGNSVDQVAAGTPYTVWKYASGLADGSNVGVKHLHYATELGGRLTRVAHWKSDASHLATVEGWAEKLYTNRSYHYGFYKETDGDIYLRMVGDRDPNDYYWVIGENSVPFILQANDSRSCGIHYWGWPHGTVCRRTASLRTVMDRNWYEGPQFGPYVYSGGTADYANDVVIQGNRITDQGIRGAWSETHQDDDVIPWLLIKDQIRNADGSTYATTKIAANCETSAILSRGGGRRTVVRRNYVEGTNNGIAMQQSGYDKYASYCFDSRYNRFRHLSDDPLEPETFQILFISRDDDTAWTQTVLSSGPTHYGPIYLIRLKAFRWGIGGVGNVASADGRTVGTVGVKYSGASSPSSKIFIYHSTLWTDDAASDGGDEFASPGANEEFIEIKNSVLRAGRHVFVAPVDAGQWVEDYNLLATSDATRGVNFNGTRTTMSAYRTASSQGANTNAPGGVDQALNSATWLDALLSDPPNGDLAMAVPYPVAKLAGVSDTVPVPVAGYRPRG